MLERDDMIDDPARLAMAAFADWMLLEIGLRGFAPFPVITSLRRTASPTIVRALQFLAMPLADAAIRQKWTAVDPAR